MAHSISQAARKAAGGKGHADVKRHVDQAYYDRFLCRIFSTQDERLLLKGGTRVLAAVPRGRATKDIDLEARDHSLDSAMSTLRERAKVDLDDFLSFTYAGSRSAVGANQPNVEAIEVKFDVEIVGFGRQSPVKVDLALHRRPSAPVVKAPPAFRLHIPQFQTFDFLMIAVEDQIADKVCAMMSGYGPSGVGSSRAKDLADIVVLALHEKIDAANLCRAIRMEAANRRISPFSSVVVSDAIHSGYGKLATTVGPIDGFRTWQEARDLVNRLIEPVLSGSIDAGGWDPVRQAWSRSR